MFSSRFPGIPLAQFGAPFKSGSAVDAVDNILALMRLRSSIIGRDLNEVEYFAQ
jgi:hypothetical protein